MQPTREQLQQRLESLYGAGVRQIPRSTYVPPAITPPPSSTERIQPSRPIERAPAPPASSHSAASPSPPRRTESPTPETSMAKKASTPRGKQTVPEIIHIPASGADPPKTPVAKKAAALKVLQEEVAGCTRCPELAAARTQTVFGVGNPKARLCFFGEAPGADEDRLGEPFIGRAGQLLTRILEACGLKREDVYILNVLRCRPPGNRNPLPDEAANCRTFFESQLQIIRPEFICCLGSVPAQTLLETNVSIGRLRGKFHTWHFAKVLATYHPAYLLRNPSAKKHVWDDMQILMREMGIEIPKS